MNRLLSAAAALLCAFGLSVFQPAVAGAQMTSVTAATGSLKIGGAVISTGTVNFTPVDINGIPIAFMTGGGGLNSPGAFSCSISAGAVSGCSIPDSVLTTPANLIYQIQVSDTSTGNPTSGRTYTLQSVIGVTGTTWALDHYGPPARTSNIAMIQAAGGPADPTGSCVSPWIYTQSTNGGVWTCVGGVPVKLNGTGTVAPAATAAALGTVQLATGQTATQLAKVASTGVYADLANLPTLGSAAAASASSFDAAGAAAAAQAAAIAAGVQKANNLSDLPNAATARTSLGLGSMATQSASSFDAAGSATTAAAAAAAASVPVAGGSMTGPLTVPKFNSTLYVTATVQAAITSACTTGSIHVVIPRGSAPSDIAGGWTGGCSTVDVSDETSGQNGSALYTWNGSAYSKGSAGNGRIAFGLDSRTAASLSTGQVGLGIQTGGTTGNAPTYKFGNWGATQVPVCGTAQGTTKDAAGDYAVSVIPCVPDTDYASTNMALASNFAIAERYCPGGNNALGTCDYSVAYENYVATLVTAGVANTNYYRLISTTPGQKCINNTIRGRYSVVFDMSVGTYVDCAATGVGGGGIWDAAPVVITGASFTLQGPVSPATNFEVTVPSTATIPALGTSYGVKVAGFAMRSENSVVTVDSSTTFSLSQAPQVEVFGKTTLNQNVISANSTLDGLVVGNTLNCTSGFGSLSTALTISSIDPTTNTFQVQIGGVNAPANFSGDTSCVESGTLTNVTLTFQPSSPMIRIGMEAGASTGVQDEFGFLIKAGVIGAHLPNSLQHPGMMGVQFCNGDHIIGRDMEVNDFLNTNYSIGGLGCSQSTASGGYQVTIRESDFDRLYARNGGLKSNGSSLLSIVNPFSAGTNNDRINTITVSHGRFASTFGPSLVYISSGWDKNSSTTPGQITFDDNQFEGGNYHDNPTDGSPAWNAKASIIWESEGQTININGGFINGVGDKQPTIRIGNVSGALNMSGISMPPKGGIQLITTTITPTPGGTAFTCTPNCLNTETMDSGTMVAVGTPTPTYMYLAGVPTSPGSGNFASNWGGTATPVTSEVVAGGFAFGSTASLYSKSHTTSGVGLGMSSLPDTYFQNGTGIKGDDFINLTGEQYSILDTATGTPFGTRIGSGPNVCFVTMTNTGPSTGLGGAGRKMTCNNYQQDFIADVEDHNRGGSVCLNRFR